MTEKQRKLLRSAGIDVQETERILEKVNEDEAVGQSMPPIQDIPQPDGNEILDIRTNAEWKGDPRKAIENFEKLDIEIDPRRYGTVAQNQLYLDTANLAELGTALFPYVAVGILNGGSATSYYDRKKNRSLSENLFSVLEPDFSERAGTSAGKPKGITPAFIHPDGYPGPSFLAMKLRSVLAAAFRYRVLAGGVKGTGKSGAQRILPVFQMTSPATDQAIKQALERYSSDPFLAEPAKALGIDITEILTARQPLVAALTPASANRPRDIFQKGDASGVLALPGGHGQNFAVLREIYLELYREGKRFAYLGNVDNLGFTPEPVEIALLALQGADAGFEFSFRTPVDVKGGILVRTEDGRMNCVDIGSAVSSETVEHFESAGSSILFNCATGIFNLDYLHKNIDHIINRLPLRISEQDKDIGRYAQAEQVTWEVIGMMDNPLIFGVDKYQRFLAAKLLIETLMTSGISGNRIPESHRALAGRLNAGLFNKLSGAYAMSRKNNRWEPLSPEEMAAFLKEADPLSLG